jgi:nucleotide-binding universal stress UspA family protein
MAGHEFFEPADRKRPVADPTAADPLAAEEPRAACDPAFQHGVVVGFDGSTIGMAHRSQAGLIIVHVANRLPTTVWAGCEPPVFVDVPDHRTEVLGLELACAEYLAEVPWILVERGGDICHELEEVGKEYEADAIVVGSTHGLVGRLFGSVAGRLAKRAQRPVVVIP